MSYKKVQGRYAAPNFYKRGNSFHHKLKVAGQPLSWPRLNGTTEREARADQEARFGINVRVPAKVNVKARDAWPEFIAAKLEQGLAETTATRYCEMWRAHGVHILGGMRMMDIQEEHIKAVFDRMKHEGYRTSPSKAHPKGQRREYKSFTQAKTALSSFFTAMAQSPFRYCTHNPVKTLGLWSPKNVGLTAIGTWVVISETEMNAIAENARETEYKFSRINETGFRLAYGTGMRLGEVAGLTWPNVLFEEGKIHCAQQLRKGFVADDPTTWYVGLKGDADKSNSKARYLPLTPADMQMLKDYREWLLSSGLYRADGPVFPTRKHTPISHRSWGRRFEEAVENAKVTRREGDLTPHCMRHSYASRLFARGVPVGVISNLLGHSTEQITKDRYIHFHDTTAQDDIVRRALEG